MGLFFSSFSIAFATCRGFPPLAIIYEKANISSVYDWLMLSGASPGSCISISVYKYYESYIKF